MNVFWWLGVVLTLKLIALGKVVICLLIMAGELVDIFNDDENEEKEVIKENIREVFSCLKFIFFSFSTEKSWSK